MSFNPVVLQDVQILMQRIGDYVRTGHVHTTCGTVARDRAQAMVRKFAHLYAVDLDRNRRLRAKSRRHGTAVLLLAESGASGAPLIWYLLVTPGEHPAHQLERLRDASVREGRVRFADYELVHVTKPNVAHPVLTWKLSREAEELWRERALAEARSGNEFRVQQFLHALRRMPGFYGIRKQVGKVMGLFRREWRRRRATRAPTLRRLGYVSRLPNRGVRIHSLPVHARYCTSPLGNHPGGGI